MPALEVVALDVATPQLRAPGAGDTYAFPRPAQFTLGTIPRVSSANAATSPLVWNSNNFDIIELIAQNAALTINADLGTPQNGQQVLFRIKDNGTARALTWTTGVSKGFREMGVTLPTTTIQSKTVYIGAIYNATDARWDAVAVGQEI